MAEYKLTYYDSRGLGEVTRFLFKYAGIPFEDIRVKGEDWPKLRGQFPFGDLPILEHNGKKVIQSVAIARYVAKKAKLTGKDEWEDLEIDAVVDAIVDLRIKATIGFKEPDEQRKAVLLQTFIGETTPFYLRHLEELAKKNNGYLAAGKLTWADFYLIALFVPTFDDAFDGDVFRNYPTLKALKKKILEFPAIKVWVEIRPKTPK